MPGEIKVWGFYKAPAKYQKLSQNGGDEDWLALVPKKYKDAYIGWLYNQGFDTCCNPQIIKLKNGDEIYIGSHA